MDTKQECAHIHGCECYACMAENLHLEMCGCDGGASACYAYDHE